MAAVKSATTCALPRCNNAAVGVCARCQREWQHKTLDRTSTPSFNLVGAVVGRLADVLMGAKSTAAPAPSPAPAATSTETAPGAMTFWPKGVGYGYDATYNDSTVDYIALKSHAYKSELAVQEMFALVSHLVKETYNASPSASQRLASRLADSRLYAALGGLLRSDLGDAAARTPLYKAALECVALVARHPEPAMVALLARRNDEKGVMELLNTFMARANANVAVLTKRDDALSPELAAAHEMVCKVYETIPVALRTEASAAPASKAVEISYTDVMGQFQFDESDIMEREFDFKPTAPATKVCMNRLGHELTALASSLPLTIDSSVFVRVDSSRMDVMQALIIGPADTPYEGGIFLFDIGCGADYPNVPPQVHLKTTGHGAVRFNPNLYNCGKVCLSLLGTWDGDQNENWNAAVSTILQVLVSIQSLIMVPHPFFNEPSYETQMDDPNIIEESRQYTENIRRYTMQHAMIDPLREQYKGFEDVINTHLYLRREHILKVTEKWVAEDTSGSAQATREALIEALNSIERPACLPPLPPAPAPTPAPAPAEPVRPATPDTPRSRLAMRGLTVSIPMPIGASPPVSPAVPVSA